MNEFYLIAAVLVTIISSARLTRLAVYDDFPPVMWVRDKYEAKTHGTGWGLLAVCGFCMSFWVTALVVIWGYLSTVYESGDSTFDSVGDLSAFTVWWLVNGTLAASYLAAMLIARDGDE